MNFLQRRLLLVASLGLSLLATTGTATAQPQYPTKPIRLMVGFAAGSTSDVIGRVVADQLSRRLGQPVVVENRPGAGGNLAAELVANAPADGYTLLLATGAVTTNAALHPNGKLNLLRDLAPVALVARTNMVLTINDKVPARTMAEFVAYAKANPHKINYGSSGLGGASHLNAELISMEAGIRMTHVPYKGNSQAGVALQSGEIQLLTDTTQLAKQGVSTGRVRALAVAGEHRSALLPEVPTFTETGYPHIQGSSFVGAVMAPAATPARILDLLNTHVNAVLKEPEVKAQLVDTGGLELLGGTREHFANELRANIDKWTKVVQASGLKSQ